MLDEYDGIMELPDFDFNVGDPLPVLEIDEMMKVADLPPPARMDDLFGGDFALELPEFDFDLVPKLVVEAPDFELPDFDLPMFVPPEPAALMFAPPEPAATPAFQAVKTMEAAAATVAATSAPVSKVVVGPAAGVAAAPEKHVLFSLAAGKYAVPMSNILEVCELEHFTSVPNVPAWVLGVTNLRGDIVSIVDVRVLLGHQAEEVAPNTSLLVTQTLQGDLTTCLMVERITGMASLSHARVQTVDTLRGDALTPHVRGVYVHREEGLLSVIDMESLLRALEIAN